MTAFKIGEVVEVVGAHARPDLIGLEATIVGEFDYYQVDTGHRYHGYPCDVSGFPGQMFLFRPQDLRRKPWPQVVTSWAKIVELTGWVPQGVTV